MNLVEVYEEDLKDSIKMVNDAANGQNRRNKTQFKQEITQIITNTADHIEYLTLVRDLKIMKITGNQMINKQVEYNTNKEKAIKMYINKILSMFKF